MNGGLLSKLVPGDPALIKEQKPLTNLHRAVFLTCEELTATPAQTLFGGEVS